MCTAVTYNNGDFYFGRTLDNDFSYREEVTVTPRRYPFVFSGGKAVKHHYAIIGMAYVLDGYPLYYDAVNEQGLCMAGLNFVGNAVYGKALPGRQNVAQFELLPWVLSQCATTEQAVALLKSTSITDTPFRPELPTAQLHWLVADKYRAITVECTAEGMHIYDNPVGVLTNNPPFPVQLQRLREYTRLSPYEAKPAFTAEVPEKFYSRGTGGVGLPGDLTSGSRFVRAAFVKHNSQSGTTEPENVGQFFHILGAVEQQRGCCRLQDGAFEITVYTGCCNATRGIYYYTTYGNRQISAVDMHTTDLEGTALARYPLRNKENIFLQNERLEKTGE